MPLEIANHMKWHANGHVNDDLLRHPTDFKAWKLFDSKYIVFSFDVRLGLATDGLNPYGNMSSAHCTWPVILILYNLPSWMCLKMSSFILSLLIPRPSLAWEWYRCVLTTPSRRTEGVMECWSKNVWCVFQKSFQMHAALLWTINNFLAYGDISGWSTKGALACPPCNYDSQYRWLR